MYLNVTFGLIFWIWIKFVGILSFFADYFYAAIGKNVQKFRYSSFRHRSERSYTLPIPLKALTAAIAV